MEPPTTTPSFETTRWTLLDRIQTGDEHARRQALDTIIRCYWPAVYASLRRGGMSRDHAAETTQAFFAEIILARGLLLHADQNRGRLRNLILTALKHFVRDQHRHARRRIAPASGAAPRDGDGSPHRRGPIPIDCIAREECRIGALPTHTPDEIFDRRWALAALEEAMRRCEQHFLQSGRDRHWSLFQQRILAPALGHCTPPPLATLAPTLGFPTPADAAAAIQVVRKRMLVLLKEVAAETATTEQDQEEEYQRLLALLS